MALAEARALVPVLRVAEIDRVRDRETLEFCALAVQQFTPLVAYDGEDGLLLDISGCAHLFGGEAGLLAKAMRRMARFGLTARAAIAATPDAAHAFARFGAGGLVAPGSQERLARGLPIVALEAGDDVSTSLARTGFSTLGDLADRSSHTLVARFGADVVAKLHAILGHADRRIRPLRPLPEIVAERHFPEPMALIESLLMVIERLAGDVAAALERRGEGGRRFSAEFYRADGVVRHLAIEAGHPLRAPSVIMRLIRLKMDALADPLDPGFGFDAVRLAVLATEPMNDRQDNFIEQSRDEDADDAVAGLVSRLVARFGRENVQRLIARDTHDPVRATAIVPYYAPDSSFSLPAPERGEPPYRPLTLFDRPQSIEATAEVPDGPPIRFRWRRILHEVARAEGPERIAPEWWQPEDVLLAVRDYYRVEDTHGHRFWIFREGFYTAEAHARWYVHGLFA
jgi:protein ImuB